MPAPAPSHARTPVRVVYMRPVNEKKSCIRHVLARRRVLRQEVYKTDDFACSGEGSQGIAGELGRLSGRAAEHARALEKGSQGSRSRSDSRPPARPPTRVSSRN